MKKNIISNHEAISATAARFLSYAVDQRQCLKKLNLLGGAVHPAFPSYKYVLHSWPWFISPATKTMLEACISRIPKLVNKAILLEFKSDYHAFAQFYSLPEVLARLFLGQGVDTRYVMQRTDAILTETGLKIVELNVGSRIGGWWINWMDGQYRKQPELAPFFRDVACETRNIPYWCMEFVVRSVIEKRLQAQGSVNVLMIVEPTFMEIAEGLAKVYFDQALDKYGCAGSMQFATSFDVLEFRSDIVWSNGLRLSALLFANNEGLLPPQQLYRSCFANQIFWPDDPLYNILADKRSLAVLKNQRDNAAFSDADRATIDQFVPWGAALSPQQVFFEGKKQDLRTLVTCQRDKFVIKVARGSQGDDVFVGKHQPADDWQRIVDRAFSEGGWLVQECCLSLPFYGQTDEGGFGEFDVIWGVFGFGDSYGGCWLRLMPKDAGDGVINCAKGAEETIVYEVAE